MPVLILPPGSGSSIPPIPQGSNLFAFDALIDTGATSTCISPDAAIKVGLQPLGKIPVRGVSGPKDHNYYLFHVAFPLGQIAKGTQQFSGHVHIFNKPIQGAELALGQGIDVLLGMDVIASGSLAVEGNGTFSFSF